MIVEKRNIDYEDYVVKQGAKARNPAMRNRLLKSRPERVQRFQRIFERAKKHLVPGAILCLGARTGCEIIGARNAGFKGSQGIDLHPIGDIAIRGDWHDIPFPDKSFENVFTNSIDHCFDVTKLANEIYRVLKPKGRLYLMLSGKQMLKTKDDRQLYMSQSQNFLFWEDGFDLVAKFEQHGFKFRSHHVRRKNWNMFLLEKVKRNER
jgi:SAM-dependent methyltransferase